MNFKIVLSDPKSKKAYQFEKDQKQTGLLGKKIGEKIPGDALGLSGFELEITGGSDKQGFPMRRDVEGAVRKKILISSPPGFHPKMKGQRKRKSIRGNTVSAEITQLNLKVVKEGTKNIAESLGIKPKETKKEEKPAKAEETKKETEGTEKKEEVKEESAKEKPKEEKPVKEPEKPKEKEAAKETKSAEEKMGIKKLED